jgi:pimeloyl-ACP methyl ester carboxylesterase
VQTLDVDVPGLTGPALLRLPDDGPPRTAVVALHGAALPQRDQPLFRHLAQTLVPVGCAVLTFDRRPAPDGGDVPVEQQAADALSALEALRERLDLPVGLYGFSQGAWAAAAAAADPRVAWLAVLGCSGVSPGDQMTYSIDQLLQRNGFDHHDRAALRELRTAVEGVLRGGGDVEHAAALLRSASTQRWFGHAYLPPELPPAGAWPDLDLDPEPLFAAVRCPVLAIWGADDESVPVALSRQAWERARATSGAAAPTLVELPGCGHFPAPGAGETADDVPLEAFSRDDAQALLEWVAAP